MDFHAHEMKNKCPLLVIFWDCTDGNRQPPVFAHKIVAGIRKEVASSYCVAVPLGLAIRDGGAGGISPPTGGSRGPLPHTFELIVIKCVKLKATI